ncbi:TrmB family transcriptional regulator [Methylobacterium sp. JK268]
MTMASLSDEILAAMAQLGFGQYEARAYCALLGRPPMNGHEVAKASGVPPSKIYETLGRLGEKGAVLVQRSDPVTYAASPYDAVLEAARRKFQRALDTADAALRALPSRREGGQVWAMQDRDTVLAACDSLIAQAERSLFAALWDEELAQLAPALEKAARRGVVVHVAIYGTTRLDGPSGYDLTLCGTSAAERLAGRRLSILVADRERTMVADFDADGGVEAISTEHRVIGLLGIEYVKADVLGRLLIDAMGEARFEQVRRDPGTIDALLRA